MQTHDCNSMYSIHGLLSAMSHSRHDAHGSFWHTPSMHYPGKCISAFYYKIPYFQNAVCLCVYGSLYEFSLGKLNLSFPTMPITHIAPSDIT